MFGGIIVILILGILAVIWNITGWKPPEDKFIMCIFVSIGLFAVAWVLFAFAVWGYGFYGFVDLIT